MLERICLATLFATTGFKVLARRFRFRRALRQMHNEQGGERATDELWYAEWCRQARLAELIAATAPAGGDAYLKEVQKRFDDGTWRTTSVFSLN